MPPLVVAYPGPCDLAFPQVGHEPAGRRPAVVLTPASYNRKVGLLLACVLPESTVTDIVAKLSTLLP
jgi:mRNA-degrading endonuclease toxin of MazEF toxin-antitoxin module